MSLSTQQIQKIHREIKPILEGAVCKGVSALAPHSFILTFHGSAGTHSLMLCFKEPYLRFHLLPSAPLGYKPGSFVAQLSDELVGERLVDCSLLNEDRILALSFEKKGQVFRLVAEFLPRRANCYLMDVYQHIIAALKPVDHLIYDLPQKPLHASHGKKTDDTALLENSQAVAAYYADLEREDAFAAKRKSVDYILKKLLQKAEWRVKERQRILEECRGWQSMHHEGLLLQSNLFRISKGMKELVVDDWEHTGAHRVIPLDPDADPRDQMADLFRKSRKLQAGIPHAEKQVRLAEQELALRHSQIKAFEVIAAEKDLKSFCDSFGLDATSSERPVEKKKVEPAKPYYIFRSEAGIEIWVGKSAKDNDILSFRSADGNDWWLHASGYPGSHVVIRGMRGDPPDPGTLNDAAELSMRYSKAKGQREGEVTLSQVKFLKSVRGVPGKVMVAKARSVRIMLDNRRWERLKASQRL